MPQTPDELAARHLTRHLRGVIHGADPDVVALEILAILRGHGWRPATAFPLPPPYRPPPGPPLAENLVHAYAAKARQAITREDA